MCSYNWNYVVRPQCKFLEVKRRNSLYYPQPQARSKWNLSTWLPLALGQQASHLIPHIRPLPAPRSAIFGKKKRKNKRKGRGYILDPQKQRDDRWRHRDTKDLSAGSKSEANQLVLLTLMHCVHITISTNHYWFQHYFYSLEAAAYSVHAGSAAELMTQLHEHKKQTNNLVTDTVQWACTPP